MRVLVTSPIENPLGNHRNSQAHCHSDAVTLALFTDPRVSPAPPKSPVGNGHFSILLRMPKPSPGEIPERKHTLVFLWLDLQCDAVNDVTSHFLCPLPTQLVTSSFCFSSIPHQAQKIPTLASNQSLLKWTIEKKIGFHSTSQTHPF